MPGPNQLGNNDQEATFSGPSRPDPRFAPKAPEQQESAEVNQNMSLDETLDSDQLLADIADLMDHYAFEKDGEPRDRDQAVHDLKQSMTNYNPELDKATGIDNAARREILGRRETSDDQLGAIIDNYVKGKELNDFIYQDTINRGQPSPVKYGGQTIAAINATMLGLSPDEVKRMGDDASKDQYDISKPMDYRISRQHQNSNYHVAASDMLYYADKMATKE